MLKNQKIWYWVKIVFGLLWLSRMLHSKAYASVYVLIAAAGLYCIHWNYVNHTKAPEGWRKLLLAVFAGLFSFCSVLANYELYYAFRLEFGSISLVGGFLLMWDIMLFAFCQLPMKAEVRENPVSPGKVFGGAFFLMAAIDLFVLFVFEYPGNLSWDSLSQVEQTITGVYSNHHPYWHTMVIKACLNLGTALFGNINAGVAVYSVFQILFMTASFAYAVVTLYQVGVPRRVVFLVLGLYALVPHNILYSITMWKDVMFAGAVLLFVTSLFRALRNVGKWSWLNYVVFGLSGICFAVWRSNGWLALLGAFVCSAIFLWKKDRKLLLLWLAALTVGHVMKVPYLEAIHVRQPDLVESLSIPVQQVARVIKDGGYFTEEELELLEQVVDVEEVPSLYKDYISDPIKVEIRSKNPAYFEEHISDYFKLWVRVGLRHPGLYVFSWVDQTKGYWNSGYRYWTLTQEIDGNELGIYKTAGSGTVRRGIAEWLFGMWVHGTPEVSLLIAIGFHTWLLAAAFIFCVVKKKTEAWLAVPVLMIIGTLLVATPVSYEFRYAYSLFITVPFIAPLSVYDARTGQN